MEIPATLPTAHPHALSAATVTVAFTDVLGSNARLTVLLWVPTSTHSSTVTSVQ